VDLTTSPISVVFVDDDDLARRALNSLLREPGIEVVAECATSAACLEAIRRHQPQVALVDMRLEGNPMGGVALIREIRRIGPETVCAVVTAEADGGDYLLQALQAGAEAYYSKGFAQGNLADLVKHLVAGDYMLEPRFTQRLARFAQGHLPTLKQTYDEQQRALSAREREVLDLLADGLKPAEIASKLCITDQTVKSHKQHIAAKLGLESQTLLVVYAVLARYLFGDLTHTQSE
jgi:DNA-binding NarL/FixJ family response regulator